MRYECIDRRRSEYPVQMMCQALRVSRSGYYAWRSRPASEREQRDRELSGLIGEIHAQSDGTYGSRKVRKELEAAGFAHGRRKVAKLMRSAGLKGCPSKRYRSRLSSARAAGGGQNLIQRDFSANQIDVRWASDMTYIWTLEGWLYLAVVMDLYSRRIVGWSMSRRITRHLALDALRMALAYRRPEAGLIHHSDRGAQYLSDDYQALLKEHRIECSMSAKGACYDNAVVESFFSLLKRERIYRRHYVTRAAARSDVFDYIERFYNRKRQHGYLGDMSPVAFENRTLRTL